MNRLIHPVGEQNLSCIEAEKITHLAFHRFTLGMACKGFGVERARLCQHPGRAAHGALVEIETQSLTSRQRRPVSPQLLHRGAGLKHWSTSPATIPRVRAIPRPRPAQWPGVQFGESPGAKLPGTK